MSGDGDWRPGARPGTRAGTRPGRFYQAVTTVETAEGWSVALDGKPLRTPAKSVFAAPQTVAQAIAAEWDAQIDHVDPDAMPMTRFVNTAIDRVAPQRDAVASDIAAYGGSDLLCYRADGPEALVARQAASWDPLLDWAANALGAPLVKIEGVMHAAQPREALAALADVVSARSDLGLTALHELTSLSGSLVLALAVDTAHLTPEAAWAASRIDEDWQIEQWGRDAEADAAAARRWRDFSTAARLAALLRDA